MLTENIPPVMNVLAPLAVQLSMVSRLLIGVGALAVVVGVVFALQGFDVLRGSGAMSGSSLWAALGPLIAVAGLVMAAAGLHRLRSASSRD
jgi:hypothetical protein